MQFDNDDVVETTPGWGKSMPVNTLLQASYMRHWHVAIDGIAEYGQQQGRMSNDILRAKFDTKSVT